MNVPNSPSVDRRRRRKQATLLAICVLAVMVLVGFQVWSGYREAIREAEIKTRNYAAIIEARLDATLRRADADVSFLARSLTAAALNRQAVPRHAGRIDADLDARMENFAELVGLRVFDAGGELLYASGRQTVPGRVNVGDRAYFHHLRDDPKVGLMFSEVVYSRAAGRLSLVAARALRDARGDFLGIVAASIELGYFQKLFQSLDTGSNGIVAIFRSDDLRLVLRHPMVENLINKPLPPDNFAARTIASGSKTATGITPASIDGVVRIRSIHVMDQYPFYVAAGVARKDVLAGWLERSLAVSLSSLLLLGLIGGLLYGMWRAQRRQMLAAARLAAIVSSSNDAIVSRSLDRKVLSWNAAAERLFGYTASEALGQNISGLIVPPDREAETAQLREWLAEGRAVRDFETVRRTKDGRLVDVSLSHSSFYDERGAMAGISLIFRDISERKKAEARQRLAASVFDNALDGILITDEHHNIIAVNRAFTELTGYSAAEAIGMRPRLLRSGHHDEAFYETMQRTLNEKGRWQGEIWDRRKSGELYCELLSISAVRDLRGAITNYCAIFTDITQRKLAQEELERLNAELEQRVAVRTRDLERANRELDAFSYSISHDLRAPLRAMISYSTMVVDANRDKLDPDSVHQLQRIHAGAYRMSQLIDDLLDLARISRQEMHRADFDLSALAHQAAALLVETHPERTVRLTVQPDMHVHGDPRLVRIVLDNLLGNAWKFTARTAEARIEVGEEERDGERVFFVRDNGAGFDMQYADKLFGAFERLHGQHEFEGTGIGLSIVQRIVIRHGGRIWAEGKIGQGATFFVTLAMH
jgi:PAS domain S-box-containing protein